MNSGHHNTDLVNAAVTILTVILGPAMAGVVGPYAVILLASLVGGGWALGRREPASRTSGALFLLLIAGTAAMVTNGLALLVASLIGANLADVNWLLAPIALCVGAVGHDWPKVGRWLVGRAGRFIDVLIELRRGGANGGRDVDQ